MEIRDSPDPFYMTTNDMVALSSNAHALRNRDFDAPPVSCQLLVAALYLLRLERLRLFISAREHVVNWCKVHAACAVYIDFDSNQFCYSCTAQSMCALWQVYRKAPPPDPVMPGMEWKFMFTRVSPLLFMKRPRKHSATG
jgi:hypothetical protein